MQPGAVILPSSSSCWLRVKNRWAAPIRLPAEVEGWNWWKLEKLQAHWTKPHDSAKLTNPWAAGVQLQDRQRRGKQGGLGPEHQTLTRTLSNCRQEEEEKSPCGRSWKPIICYLSLFKLVWIKELAVQLLRGTSCGPNPVYAALLACGSFLFFFWFGSLN